MAWGLLNSRPSTRLGAVAVRMPCCCKTAWPKIREGAGLKTVCASAACLAAKSAAAKAKAWICLNYATDSLPELLQVRVNQCDRQSHYIEVATLDALDEFGR